MPKIWTWSCCNEDAPCAVHLSSTDATVYLADPLRARLEAVAEAEGSTLKAVLTDALHEYVDAPRP